MVPAAMGGIPGGIELAVMGAMLLLLAGVAFAVVTVGRTLFGGAGDATRERVAELESRVEELEAEVGDEREDG